MDEKMNMKKCKCCGVGLEIHHNKKECEEIDQRRMKEEYEMDEMSEEDAKIMQEEIERDRLKELKKECLVDVDKVIPLELLKKCRSKPKPKDFIEEDLKMINSSGIRDSSLREELFKEWLQGFIIGILITLSAYFIVY